MLPHSSQESDNDEIPSVEKQAPCFHVECVMHESQSSVSEGKHHPVHHNVNYFGQTVVPICLWESDSEPYALRSTTPGHPPAYMILVRDDSDSSGDSICMCKVQKDKGHMIVRCLSSSQHGSVKSRCCIAARDFFNGNATTITGLMTGNAGAAILRAELPAVKHTATSSTFTTQSFRPCEGFHPAKPPHWITARKRWYERQSDNVQVTVQLHDGGREIPKLVILKRAPPTAADGHEREERVRHATVWGQQQAVQVCIIEWLVKQADGTTWMEGIQGADLGLFRFSVNEYFDAGMLYEFLWMSSPAGKVTMQAFHGKILNEYASFRASEFSQGSSSQWIEFPNNTKFNTVIHCFKVAHVSPSQYPNIQLLKRRSFFFMLLPVLFATLSCWAMRHLTSAPCSWLSQEYNQNRFLKHVDVCPWCGFNSNIQVWDGTFRFILSKYLDKE